MRIVTRLLRDDGDCHIHIRVHSARDIIGPRLVECDSGRVAWIRREPRVCQLLWGVGIGDALAIMAHADDMQTARITWIDELEWRARFDGDRRLGKICLGEVNMVYRTTWRACIAARGLATARRHDGAKQQERKHEYCQLFHQ